MPSLPVRECGLKLTRTLTLPGRTWSLPVRECGLKSLTYPSKDVYTLVTPRAGVWIEIRQSLTSELTVRRHSPCGSVD